MARYSNEFKERAVARLVPPESAEITRLSQGIGVSVATLERWLADAARLEAVIYGATIWMGGRDDQDGDRMSRREDSAAVGCRWQELSFRLIVAGRHEADVLGRGVACRTAKAVVCFRVTAARAELADVKELDIRQQPAARLLKDQTLTQE